MSENKITIEVAYAQPEKQVLKSLQVPVGTTVQRAIELSGIQDDFPDLKIDPDRLGIFSNRAAPEQQLADGDRVEIYRPLIADPKEARRKRALKQAQ